MSLSGETSVYAVVGDPVRRSLSPRIHNRWMAAAGLDAVYVALNLKSERADDELAALARAGLAGLNVTLPHKAAALKAAITATEAARRIGAANTLVRGEGGWVAHNTDVEGFEMALSEAAPGDLSGRRVLMLGAGGAARAAADVLARGRADLVIANRTRARAESLAAELAPGARIVGLDEIAAEAHEAHLIVQTSSAGHEGAGIPELPSGGGRPFLDLSYGAAAESARSTAGRAGWTPHDGLAMLVGQAAAAFRLWFGRTPDMQSALADCRKVLAGAP